ncbi:MAG: baseplate J/gp47 family protein [Sumerlaeia bacterium]
MAATPDAERLTKTFADLVAGYEARIANATLDTEEGVTAFAEALAGDVLGLSAALANLPPLDPTARDFAAIRESQLAYLRARFPELNDELASNHAVALLEAFAHTQSLLHYYLDNRIEEAFADRAQERRSALSHAKLRGYRPSGAIPAQVTLTLTHDGSNPAATVSVAAGRKAQTSGGVVFETTEAAFFPAGVTSVSVLAKQQETRTATASGTGAPGQRVTIPGLYLAGTAAVTSGAVSYAEVEDFDEAAAGDAVFRVDFDPLGNAEIVFGDGGAGRSPASGETITASFKVGGGAQGNVAAGAIATLPNSAATDSNGDPVKLYVSNARRSYGGRDRESVAEILRRSRTAARTQKSSVAREDFIHFAEQVVGVRRAGLLTVNELENMAEATAAVVVLAGEGVSFDSALAREVARRFTIGNPRTVGVDVQVHEAERLDVPIAFELWVTDGADRGAVEAAIRSKLAAFFDPDGRKTDFGRPVYRSVLTCALQSVPGVRNVNLTAPAADVTPSLRQLPRLGTVTITEGGA